MKTQKLWFVRHGGRVSGPFPAKLISQDFMLGRFQATDEASIDRVLWAQIQEIPELQPRITPIKNRIVGTADAPLDWERERREAALRWVDERHRHDRRDQEGAQAIEINRRGPDRRIHPESPEWAALRQRHADLEAALKQRRERFIGIGIVLLGLLALVLYAVFSFSPVNPVKVGFHGPYAACSEPASNQVNWARCDKNGAWLIQAPFFCPLSSFRLGYIAESVLPHLGNFYTIPAPFPALANSREAQWANSAA